MRRLPFAYVVILATLVIVGAWALLTYFGVPPFDNLSLFIIFNAAAIITLLISGVVGGVFVGMLLAQRLLGNREFTPFERTVLLSLEEIRERLDKLENEEKRLRR